MIRIKTVKSKNGNLNVLQKFPFKVERIYYLNDLKKNSLRTAHAHKKLKQILICISGKFEIYLESKKSKIKKLFKKNEIVFIDRLTWRSLKCLEKHSTILVLASAKYDKKDYIRNYQKFINLIK
tara:strand:+ start:6089 stop:6460 length:372 start_codon:yes stop_codon:yes gene_type:complete